MKTVTYREICTRHHSITHFLPLVDLHRHLDVDIFNSSLHPDSKYPTHFLSSPLSISFALLLPSLFVPFLSFPRLLSPPLISFILTFPAPSSPFIISFPPIPSPVSSFLSSSFLCCPFILFFFLLLYNSSSPLLSSLLYHSLSLLLFPSFLSLLFFTLFPSSLLSSHLLFPSLTSPFNFLSSPLLSSFLGSTDMCCLTVIIGRPVGNQSLPPHKQRCAF